MKIMPIASGSSGNCYLVEIENYLLMLDCGLSFARIEHELWKRNLFVTNVDACFVSHSHSDHAYGMVDLCNAGVDVYASLPTIKKGGLDELDFTHVMDKIIVLGNDIYVSSFDVEHDAEGTLGFLITTKKEALLYVTDTPFLPFFSDGLTHIMIEANYDKNLMLENVKNGMNEKRAVRTANNHMCIDTTIATLGKLDKSKLEEVWLLHLSKENGAPEEFLRKAKEVCGCRVYLA